jgi:hypothetical protein
MNLSIQLGGLDAVTDAWNRAPEMVVDELAKFADAAALFMQGEIQERTPTAQGNLRASFIAQDPERLAEGVIGQVGTSLNYAVPVELGTKPHFPPVDAVLDWVKVKLGVPETQAHGVAFAIARKIAQRGTKGAFMVQRAIEDNEAEVQRQFAATVETIKARLAGAA